MSVRLRVRCAPQLTIAALTRGRTNESSARECRQKTRGNALWRNPFSSSRFAAVVPGTLCCATLTRPCEWSMSFWAILLSVNWQGAVSFRRGVAALLDSRWRPTGPSRCSQKCLTRPVCARAFEISLQHNSLLCDSAIGRKDSQTNEEGDLVYFSFFKFFYLFFILLARREEEKAARADAIRKANEKKLAEERRIEKEKEEERKREEEEKRQKQAELKKEKDKEKKLLKKERQRLKAFCKVEDLGFCACCNDKKVPFQRNCAAATWHVIPFQTGTTWGPLFSELVWLCAGSRQGSLI